eukprot:TRINITY_DN11457_c0_g1_i1.p1 TRINITY_DN11457_c0_g1~~TRINITY_DN11457_c0_g1_i1.p1  ORF type:complete len:808 (-),score=135.98 TRINITY_DN11457_c0_g1_i1:87-2510(-)
MAMPLRLALSSRLLHCTQPRATAAAAAALCTARRGASFSARLPGTRHDHDHAVGPSLSHSRSREVDAACAALAESAKLGDEIWFERVLFQLRGILEERKAATGTTIVHTDAPSLKAVVPEPSDDFAVAARSAPLEAYEATASSNYEEEPAWVHALRLLEAAAADKQVESNVEPVQVQPASPPESGIFLGAANDDDSGEDLAAYLESFHTSTGTPGISVPSAGMESMPPGMEPAWAHAMRLLESVALDGAAQPEDTPFSEEGSETLSSSGDISFSALDQNNDEHAGEDLRMDRYKRLLGDTDVSGKDRARITRMNAFSDLLQEADRIGRIAPGASIPSMRSRAPRPDSQAKQSVPPPPPAHSAEKSKAKLPSSSSSSVSSRSSQQDDPRSQAVGRGNLVPALPDYGDEQGFEDAELRKEDFVWSEHEFNDGEKKNKQTLKRFRREFKAMADATPEGLRNPKLLTAALDLALACVKCYELDKAEAIYRRAIGECRRRGLPWDVKCIQDMATLRCKQNRQADAADLLEELANKAPPHPATFINLGTVYNQLRQYDRAESWFQQAVNLKGGVPGREDHWNLGIVRKNQGRYDEALPMLEQALAEFQEHEPEHPVTIAKLHSTVGGCLHDMGRTAEAAEQYGEAHALYVATVGKMSPLFCSAAEGLAKALKAERRFEEAFDALLEAFEVHARGDAVHPTPLFEDLQLALAIHDQLLPSGGAPLARLVPLIDAAVDNLDRRGLAVDGNAGLVMSRGGKVLLRTEDRTLAGRAAELLERAAVLIRGSHDAGEADLSHEILEADALLQQAREIPS